MVSTDKVAAVVAMALVGFVVLFAGIVAPQAARCVDRGAPDVRPPVSRWRSRHRRRAPPARVDDRRRHLHRGLPAGLAAPWHDNLRRRLAAASAAVARLADARARGTERSGGTTRPSRPSWRACASSSRGRRTRRPAPRRMRVALSKLVGRVEWVAGNTAVIGDEHWSTEPRPGAGGHRAGGARRSVGGRADLRRRAHPVEDPVRIEAVQDSTGGWIA